MMMVRHVERIDGDAEELVGLVMRNSRVLVFI